MQSYKKSFNPPSTASEETGFDIDSVIDKLLEVRGCRPGKQVNLREYQIRTLCLKARQIFLSQPILLELQAPIKICGDVHGQYYDLLRIFQYGEYPPLANYLFLGDYVDRGQQSLQTICLLLAYKVKYPENFFLLRGNHQCASINRIYGFYDQVKRRYDLKLWKTFTDCFNCLPIAAIIDDKIFCMHGGLSPELDDLKKITKIMRPTDVPDTGLLCDLLWSDPDKDIQGWGDNDRGVSFTFSNDVVDTFLKKQRFDLICRAHQVVEDGYQFFSRRKLVTLFSAPNYCGEFDNCGAVMTVDDSLMCSFQILKPPEKKTKFSAYGAGGAPVNLLQTKQEVSSPSSSKSLNKTLINQNQTDSSTKIEIKSKSCGGDKILQATQSAICQTCKATKVYEINGKFWADIPFTPIQREKAQKLFKQLDSTLPMSNFTVGFSEANICFGSQKIHGNHNLFGTLNALGVYDFSDVKLNKLFDFSLEVEPYYALFWGKWQNANFDQVFFKINSNTTLPTKTSKDELKLQLQVIDIDSLLREVRFEGKIDYPGRQNLDFDPFQITLSHAQLKQLNQVDVKVKPQKNTTVSDIISPVTSPKFLQQIPSPRGVSNIDNMGINEAYFVIQLIENKKSQPSKLLYSYHLSKTRVQLKQIEKISINPQLNIKEIQSSLTVTPSKDPLHSQTFLFKMQMNGTSILGRQEVGNESKKFITSIEYSDSTEQYAFQLKSYDKNKAILTIADIQKYLAHMISAKDVYVKAVPRGIDNSTVVLVQKLALDSIVIQNPQIEIKYRPYQAIKVTGSSSIFIKRDADIQILLTNNQGRVEVVSGIKFIGQNNAINALEQVFNINQPVYNATVNIKNATLANVNNNNNSSISNIALQNNSLANFKTNFQINQIVFIISRNDINLKDVPGLNRINSAVLVDQMTLNEGLNLSVNAQLPTQCTDSAVFCILLSKILQPLNLTLYSKVYNGIAQLSGSLKKPMVLDDKNVEIIKPELVIQVKANEDINLKIRGRIEDFKVFVDKEQENQKIDDKSKLTPKQQAQDKNLQPVFTVEITNHLNVQLLVIAQSSEVVKAQTSPKQMVQFTQLRLTSIIPKNSTLFTTVRLSGLGVFGQKCLSLPQNYNDTPKVQILEKSSKQELNKTNTKIQKTIQANSTLSDNCYALWIQFGDQPIDLSGKKKPPFYGVVKASTFSQFLRPFIILQQKDQDYMSFFRYNFISAISDDFTMKQNWVRLQFNPYMTSIDNKTVPGYKYHAPAVFMGCQGSLTGTIIPKTQKIDAQIDLQPILIAKQNIKILSINYDYIMNKGISQSQISSQRATTHIQYYPNIPHEQQVFIDTSVQMFEVQNTTRITAKIFNGTLPFLLRVTGSYTANLKQIPFRCHGQLGSNQARIDLQNDIKDNLAKKRDQASNIIWMINSQKSKTLSNLSLIKKTRICNKDSCPFITQCQEGEKHSPLMSCKTFQKKEKCVSERQICPHYKEQCVKMRKQCARYNTSSGKCLKEYEVCDQWQNTCTSKLSKVCTWREYLHYLNQDDQGTNLPLVQIVNVQFDTELNEYKNPISIEVLIKVQLAFEDEKQFVIIKTSGEIIQQRDLLVNQISNAIIKHIAIKLDIDDYQLWKNLVFVQDLIQNIIDDKKMLSINKEIKQTESDQTEYDWILQQLKNMKYNELGQTEGEVIQEKLRAKKDRGEFLPKDIQILMEKIATSKERIVQFELERDQKGKNDKNDNNYKKQSQKVTIMNNSLDQGADGSKGSKKETKNLHIEEKNKQEINKQSLEDELKNKGSQQIVSEREITPTSKAILTPGSNHTTSIKNGLAPENY